MTLRQYLGEHPPRGAFSRIAERAGVSVNTVRRIYDGAKNCYGDIYRRVQNAIHARIKLDAKPRSDKGKARKRAKR